MIAQGTRHGGLRVACAAGSSTSARDRQTTVPQRRARASWVTKKLNQHRNGTSNLLRTKAVDEGSEDADFEDRLAKLRAAKGTKGRGQGGTKAKATEAGKPKKVYDYTGETVFYEGKPSAGDLAVNVALGATLLWLPLSFAAIGRFAWVNYKITDKRISVYNTSPIANDESQLDCAYEEVADVQAIGRGFGLWGDMVVKLKDGSKIEIRSIDKWQEIREYILARVAEASKQDVKEVEAKPVGF